MTKYNMEEADAEAFLAWVKVLNQNRKKEKRKKKKRGEQCKRN